MEEKPQSNILTLTSKPTEAAEGTFVLTIDPDGTYGYVAEGVFDTEPHRLLFALDLAHHLLLNELYCVDE